MSVDLKITGGTVVTPAGPVLADLLVADGKVAGIADNVAVRSVLARQQVTRPSVVTSLQKGVADRAAELAGD